MAPFQVVLDTNVLVAGLRSSRGASHRLLRLIGETPAFEINLSVPLVFEYEEVLKRESRALGLTHADIDDFLNYLCLVGNKWEIFFLWRPLLSDPNDDLVLELAVQARCEYLVTFNLRHFSQATAFGIAPLTPHRFLERIGEIT